MRSPLPRSASRPIDVACLGRLAVDLYGQQIGARLEDVTSFAKYLGGSSANVAFGTARLGLRSAMLSRVGDDHMGRFLTETLDAEGCDTSQVKVDAERLTALAILGIKDRDTFPLLFYRENCADMAIDAGDIDESFIASCRALAITGTHLSTPGVLAASTRALELARKHDVRTVLDIDYRPVLWGLTGRGEGERRFVAADHVTAHLQGILGGFDVIVGTEEEFHIAGGSEDLLAALRAVRGISNATLVVKRGPLGCSIVDGAVPADIDEAPTFRGSRVDVLNVLGAGDAFLSGFLAGWLRGETVERACAFANACGAIVVSRHGCAPAMPGRAELDAFLAREGTIRRPDLDADLSHLHRTAVPRKAWDELYVFAFDHRVPFFEIARQAGADEARIPRLKELLVEAVAATERAGRLQGHVGLLADDRYGQDALNAATGRGWWIGRPVEVSGSNPLELERGRSIGSQLVAWPREHVIKCLVAFDPDADPLLRVEQETQLRSLYDAATLSGHELLLEVIPPGCPDPVVRDEKVLRSLKRIYNLGIRPDWWKLCPPRRDAWAAIDALIHERDPHCRGVLLLGLNAPAETLAAGFADASASETCRGFAVGRTIFADCARAWLAGDIDDDALVAQAQASFERMIALWRDGRSTGRRIEEGAAA
ncbi:MULTISPECIES: 5-dehydro-2-deoxygluconokinase [unclassified Luteibacter]|uniref:bifunctional 5-dehydro-2-deoxygluconokinase/5-dehydro-2- deoxyphosphogluconate aldolase n=1 Tax=unclassified Luteibacter TaxID=2620188 RepID=UPI0008CC3988|nr:MULTISPECIES: 5-dehydro-2-deoxygluconokinase [unclassified Luteibacter]SEP07257.1 5-dehydro-2-deoxygluconokinase [Luteibacter sp. UNC138MFCol5.1]SEW15592.1 5-dehydro-2-deoxygluconokinase [Luteibacter sp. 329MFSha]